MGRGEWWEEGGRGLTAINVLGGLLLLLASAVLRGCLDSETGLGAGGVKVAVVVHGLLERVAFPAEDVVTVSGRATRSRNVSCLVLF